MRNLVLPLDCFGLLVKPPASLSWVLPLGNEVDHIYEYNP